MLYYHTYLPQPQKNPPGPGKKSCLTEKSSISQQKSAILGKIPDLWSGISWDYFLTTEISEMYS